MEKFLFLLCSFTFRMQVKSKIICQLIYGYLLDCQIQLWFYAIFHLLDDSLTIYRPDACGDRTVALLCTIFHRLILPLYEKKSIGPTL